MSEQAPAPMQPDEMNGHDNLRDAMLYSKQVSAAEANDNFGAPPSYEFPTESSMTQKLDAAGNVVAEDGVDVGKLSQNLSKVDNTVTFAHVELPGAENATDTITSSNLDGSVYGSKDTVRASVATYTSGTEYRDGKPYIGTPKVENAGPADRHTVNVKRLALNGKTGTVDQGTVTRLTGERAERANEILARKAARAVGSAAVRHAEQQTEDFKSRMASF